MFAIRFVSFWFVVLAGSIVLGQSTSLASSKKPFESDIFECGVEAFFTRGSRSPLSADITSGHIRVFLSRQINARMTNALL